MKIHLLMKPFLRIILNEHLSSIDFWTFLLHMNYLIFKIAKSQKTNFDSKEKAIQLISWENVQSKRHQCNVRKPNAFLQFSYRPSKKLCTKCIQNGRTHTAKLKQNKKINSRHISQPEKNLCWEPWSWYEVLFTKKDQ